MVIQAMFPNKEDQNLPGDLGDDFVIKVVNRIPQLFISVSIGGNAGQGTATAVQTGRCSGRHDLCLIDDTIIRQSHVGVTYEFEPKAHKIKHSWSINHGLALEARKACNLENSWHFGDRTPSTSKTICYISTGINRVLTYVP